MDPKTRYAQERLEGKINREQQIVDAARRVFTSKGIEKTTMQDVAREAGVGIATVFRFFPKKDKLLVAVATRNLESVLELFRTIAAMPVSGLRMMELLFDHSIAMLEQSESDNVKLIENFDSYAAHQAEPLEDIARYHAVYRQISETFATIVATGTKDGSIRPDIPIRDTLTTVVNAFMLFARKLALQKNLLFVQQDLAPEAQLAVLRDIVLGHVRNPERPD